MGPAGQHLLRVLDDRMAVARARSGSRLRCGPGCFGCCIGPFPITAMDAARLREGLALAQDSVRQRLIDRATEACQSLRAGYPGDPQSGVLDSREAGRLFEEPALVRIPCPVLDLECGVCQLYAHRPIACRTYGPAIVLEGRPLPHCSLNYQGLSTAEVEQLRVDVDPGDAGLAAWQEFAAQAPAPPPGDTVVAFAILR